MTQGKFISLEGIDGVGKTSCASTLCERLNSDKEKYVYVNRKVISTNDEYIKMHMEHLYAIMWKKGEVFSKAPNIPYNGLTPEHWRYLMLAWYSAFQQYMLLPVLNEGISVITDGYVYKEIAKAIYSTGSFDTEKEFDFLYKPDITFYLTASPESCLREDSYVNRIESGMFVGMESDFVKHQNKMKLIYDKLANDKHWITIARDRNVHITCDEIIKELQLLI